MPRHACGSGGRDDGVPIVIAPAEGECEARTAVALRQRGLLIARSMIGRSCSIEKLVARVPDSYNRQS